MITYKKTLDAQWFEDLFVTALEGGSNYWCDFSDETIDQIRSLIPDRGVPFSIKVFMAVVKEQMVVPIVDAESPEDVIGELSFATFGDRIQLAANDGYIVGDDEMDAGAADVIFQYLALGEIVYG